MENWENQYPEILSVRRNTPAVVQMTVVKMTVVKMTVVRIIVVRMIVVWMIVVKMIVVKTRPGVQQCQAQGLVFCP